MYNSYLHQKEAEARQQKQYQERQDAKRKLKRIHVRDSLSQQYRERVKGFMETMEQTPVVVREHTPSLFVTAKQRDPSRELSGSYFKTKGARTFWANKLESMQGVGFLFSQGPYTTPKYPFRDRDPHKELQATPRYKPTTDAERIVETIQDRALVSVAEWSSVTRSSSPRVPSRSVSPAWRHALSKAEKTMRVQSSSPVGSDHATKTFEFRERDREKEVGGEFITTFSRSKVVTSPLQRSTGRSPSPPRLQSPRDLFPDLHIKTHFKGVETLANNALVTKTTYPARAGPMHEMQSNDVHPNKDCLYVPRMSDALLSTIDQSEFTAVEAAAQTPMRGYSVVSSAFMRPNSTFGHAMVPDEESEQARKVLQTCHITKPKRENPRMTPRGKHIRAKSVSPSTTVTSGHLRTTGVSIRT